MWSWQKLHTPIVHVGTVSGPVGNMQSCIFTLSTMRWNGLMAMYTTSSRATMTRMPNQSRKWCLSNAPRPTCWWGGRSIASLDVDSCLPTRLHRTTENGQPYWQPLKRSHQDNSAILLIPEFEVDYNGLQRTIIHDDHLKTTSPAGGVKLYSLSSP